ncbi:MAG: dolichyl-phosphate beta-glucosyltransferase [Patescibacteria group bacterium]|jgi:glycosyltransferase involved in cell wall biosynthesis
MLVSIILPAYNESGRITDALNRLQAYLKTVQWTYEVFLVDDGSSDDTVALTEAHALTVKVLRHEQNKGKGAAVKTGACAAKGDFICITDVDLSTPIETLDLFLKEIHERDIVIGSRSVRGAQVVKPQSLHKVMLGRFGNVLIRLFATPHIADTQNGFKLFRTATTRILFEQQRHDRWGFDFELLFLARRKKLRVKEVPIFWRNDDRSKVRSSDYLKTLFELFTLRLDTLRGRYQ